TYTLSGLEQDVILRANPPAPSTFGLPNLTTRLEVMTEWYDTPQPVKTPHVISQKVFDPVLRDQMAEPDLVDETLSFGEVHFSEGRAFWQNQPDEATDGFHAPVGKKWETIGARTLLFEAIEYEAIETELNKLPASSQQGAWHDRSDELIYVSLGTKKRKLPDPLFRQPTQSKMTASKQGMSTEPGFVIDYVTVVTINDFTFETGLTYYIGGRTVIDGTTVFEPGAVIKYGPYASDFHVFFSNDITFLSTAEQPVIFTARDDDTVGETLPSSDGDPSGHFGRTGLYIYYLSGSSPVEIKHAKFRHIYGAIITYTDVAYTLKHCTFLDGLVGVRTYGGTSVSLENVLFDGIQNNAIVVEGSQLTDVDGSHLTVHDCGTLSNHTASSTTFDVTLKNSLIVDVSTINTYVNQGQSHNKELSNYSDAFQTLGAGEFYLKDNSPYRDFDGVASISTSLEADFAKRTTYPPISYPDNYAFSQDTRLRRVIPRDNDQLDLGYHYPVADYALGNAKVEDGVSIQIDKGCVLMTYAFTGFEMWGDSQIHMNGTATQPVVCVQYRSFQEQSTSWGLNNFYAVCIDADNASEDITLKLEHAHCHGLYKHYQFVSVHKDGFGSPNVYPDIQIKHCQLFSTRDGISVDYNDDYAFVQLDLINNLFYLSEFKFEGHYRAEMYNNFLWKNESVYFHPMSSGLYRWNVYDNFFYDNFLLGSNHSYIDHGDNGYIDNPSSSYERLTPTQSSDVVYYSDRTFSSGHLGNFYQDSSTSTLWDVGSRLASAAGLYHYTARDTYAKETTSTVDIGFHYVATDTNGYPIDTDGDLIPDYLEDADGDGVFDTGESDWQSSENGTTGVPGLQVFFPN
ncbi:MAG: hypothetical protein MI810_09480, partial [Flavobacteriales bacterium]|nr:hypothetical protein [Flavobacteriales bacterium]